MQQAQAYEGYFNNGKFYVSGKTVHIPERRRILIAILGDTQSDTDKQTAWGEFKHMVNETEHENSLLDGDVFLRRDSGRDFISFVDGV